MDRLEVPRTEPTAIEGSVQDGKSKGMQVVIRDDLKPPSGGRNPKGSKLKGQMRDSPEVRLSKTLSWILRHGAKSEGLAMRPDGYIRVIDLVSFYATHIVESVNHFL
jgi:RNA:NAD 2'-phosphotransferase (TPT1/KptA family)